MDEPTNHLDADSITWLRGFLKSFNGAVVIISHDVELLAETVTRVMHLDATRAELELYSMGWEAYLRQREVDERRRRRETPTPRNRHRRCATNGTYALGRPPRPSRRR